MAAGTDDTMSQGHSRSPRKMILGILVFWLAVGAAVAGRVAYFDQITATATARPL
ncbi:hypothetical protein HPT29_004630 [Microvirga terrae]|uniref:Uncharacterized protein n=1 Tax=Microvirga terrae TaxID=2740529 RepID=A0ABY5RXC9_9HYPH|nr:MULTISPECIES: hypothetical protein [Microvirga]MBQ0822709.1 hypothetical protein [Microvirga sp. HBU67558]UVF20437.1 hypothetical protein HPT29_004630 [Microvirga terrae]